MFAKDRTSTRAKAAHKKYLRAVVFFQIIDIGLEARGISNTYTSARPCLGRNDNAGCVAIGAEHRRPRLRKGNRCQLGRSDSVRNFNSRCRRGPSSVRSSRRLRDSARSGRSRSRRCYGSSSSSRRRGRSRTRRRRGGRRLSSCRGSLIDCREGAALARSH